MIMCKPRLRKVFNNDWILYEIVNFLPYTFILIIVTKLLRAFISSLKTLVPGFNFSRR